MNRTLAFAACSTLSPALMLGIAPDAEAGVVLDESRLELHENWGKQHRSVGLFITDGGSLGSGSVINPGDLNSDGSTDDDRYESRWVLTAAHVIVDTPGIFGAKRRLDRAMVSAAWTGVADADAEQAEEHLLDDDTAAVLDHLADLDRPVRVDVWADNAGFELVSDLALIDGLLATDAVDRVVIHLKGHPTFVSDALIDDVHDTLATLAASDDAAVRALAERLREALVAGALRLRDAWVWTSPLRGRELPAHARAELARADLLISKGDANYRRLLGDRHWDFTTPFEAAAAPLPVPVLALRTLKSEVAAGLTREQLDRLDQKDPDWAVNGRWGLIQYAPASSDAMQPVPEQ